MTNEMINKPNIGKEKVLYTVGHSRHPIAHFINLLKEHTVTLIFDVRSIPYSRRNPQFNQKTLASRLANEGDRLYLFR